MMIRSMTRVLGVFVGAATLVACGDEATNRANERAPGVEGVEPAPGAEPGVVEQSQDGALAARVRSALAQGGVADATQITVESKDGVVQLSGFVGTAQAKADAGRVARNVDGVRDVTNNLTVGDVDRTAGQVVDDAALTTRARAALTAVPDGDYDQVVVEVLDGVVQLSGWVPTANDKMRAGDAVRALEGVKDVNNKIQVQ